MSVKEFKVELRKRKKGFFEPKAFSYSRYPGFQYKKDGKYAYHWEAFVREYEIAKIKKQAQKDGYKVVVKDAMNLRSSSYRKNFFEMHDEDEFVCQYCHRKFSRDVIDVDHLISVKLASSSKIYQYVLKNWIKAKTVNDLENLVPACHPCNLKKGSKGGLWVIRGLLYKEPAKYHLVQFVAYVISAVTVVFVASILIWVFQSHIFI